MHCITITGVEEDFRKLDFRLVRSRFRHYRRWATLLFLPYPSMLSLSLSLFEIAREQLLSASLILPRLMGNNDN